MSDRPVKGFHHLKRAWYGDANLRMFAPHEMIDEVMFGWYYLVGGCGYEMRVKWTLLGGEATAQVRVFDESFAAFVDFEDVFQSLAHRKRRGDGHLTPEAFCQILVDCGLTGLTATERQ